MTTTANPQEHAFAKPTEDTAEVCACGATFAYGFNRQYVKVAHLAAFDPQWAAYAALNH